MLLLYYIIGILAAVVSGGCPGGWQRYQTTCYRVFDTSATYASAHRQCKHHLGHLVTPKSNEENLFIRDIIQGYLDDIFWIGLVYNGNNFYWVDDGSKVNWSLFYGPLPSEELECILMIGAVYWVAYNCHDKYMFVCERSIRQQAQSSISIIAPSSSSIAASAISTALIPPPSSSIAASAISTAMFPPSSSSSIAASAISTALFPPSSSSIAASAISTALFPPSSSSIAASAISTALFPPSSSSIAASAISTALFPPSSSSIAASAISTALFPPSSSSIAASAISTALFPPSLSSIAVSAISTALFPPSSSSIAASAIYTALFPLSSSSIAASAISTALFPSFTIYSTSSVTSFPISIEISAIPFSLLKETSLNLDTNIPSILPVSNTVIRTNLLTYIALTPASAISASESHTNSLSSTVVVPDTAAITSITPTATSTNSITLTFSSIAILSLLTTSSKPQSALSTSTSSVPATAVTTLMTLRTTSTQSIAITVSSFSIAASLLITDSLVLQTSAFEKSVASIRVGSSPIRFLFSHIPTSVLSTVIPSTTATISKLHITASTEHFQKQSLVLSFSSSMTTAPILSSTAMSAPRRQTDATFVTQDSSPEFSVSDTSSRVRSTAFIPSSQAASPSLTFQSMPFTTGVSLSTTHSTSSVSISSTFKLVSISAGSDLNIIHSAISSETETTVSNTATTVSDTVSTVSDTETTVSDTTHISDRDRSVHVTPAIHIYRVQRERNPGKTFMDHRPSAVGLGSLGAFIIVSLLVCIFLLDLTKLGNDIKFLKRNVSHFWSNIKRKFLRSSRVGSNCFSEESTTNLVLKESRPGCRSEEILLGYMSEGCVGEEGTDTCIHEETRNDFTSGASKGDYTSEQEETI